VIFLHCFNHVLDLIYPTVCGMCEKIDPDGLCNKCNIKLKKELFIKVDNYEKDTKKYFMKHIYISKYSDIIRQKIIEYKFRQCSYLSKFFSHLFLKQEKICVLLKKYDIILPVPIHKKRKIQRGYNQSELIAKNIAKKFENLEIDLHSLKKKQNNLPQSTLDKEGRTQNTVNTYAIENIENIKGKKILLLDDVYTTGSTANECSRVLIQQGKAERVDVLTIAKD